jgi:mono/diheme cytochrome c family protein
MSANQQWTIVAAIAVLLFSGLVAWSLRSEFGDGVVEVEVPKLSPRAEIGKTAFEVNCAECHGNNAAGSDKGPPLVHDIYNPGHHSDAAFVFAAKRGVRQHHWRFGAMPPQPRVNDGELKAIIRFVRELQTANGIEYRPHKM